MTARIYDSGINICSVIIIIEDYNTWHFLSPFAYRLLTYMWNLHCKGILVDVLFNTKQNENKSRKHYFQGPKNSKNSYWCGTYLKYFNF